MTTMFRFTKPALWALATAIKGAEFKTVDNAGHAVFLDQPQRFHDLLADFVKRFI